MTAIVWLERSSRAEYASLVASLTRRVGVRHLAAIEDAVQSAFVRAMERWPLEGLPERPSAWLFRVASNQLIDRLRRGSRARRLLAAYAAEPPPDEAASQARFSSEIQDDLLRMLFVCCNDALPVSSQLALALKTLCGFGVHEIAIRTFSSEAAVYKRIDRARARLRELAPDTSTRVLEPLEPQRFASRVSGVNRVLYLLFTEGHLSATAEAAIRRELCDEALRLGLLLARHPVGDTPETAALLALLHLHRARLDARDDGAGGLLLLEQQDRSHWCQTTMAAGFEWLARSARGDSLSRYHAEAAIAAEHCLAASFEATRWDRIAESYALLERVAPSPLHRLNRAVAVAQWRGPVAGLAVLEGLAPPTWLAGSYLWSAVAADLHRRAGHPAEAARFCASALASAPTPAVRDSLRKRLQLEPLPD